MAAGPNPGCSNALVMKRFSTPICADASQWSCAWAGGSATKKAKANATAAAEVMKARRAREETAETSGKSTGIGAKGGLHMLAFVGALRVGFRRFGCAGRIIRLGGARPRAGQPPAAAAAAAHQRNSTAAATERKRLRVQQHSATAAAATAAAHA